VVDARYSFPVTAAVAGDDLQEPTAVVTVRETFVVIPSPGAVTVVVEAFWTVTPAPDHV
jgi:hypothetical protein